MFVADRMRLSPQPSPPHTGGERVKGEAVKSVNAFESCKSVVECGGGAGAGVESV